MAYGLKSFAFKYISCELLWISSTANISIVQKLPMQTNNQSHIDLGHSFHNTFLIRSIASGKFVCRLYSNE